MNIYKKTLDMSKMNKTILAVLATVLFVGCGDFGDLNTDPNNPSSAQTDLLLTNAQTSIDDVIGAFTGTLYVQYFSETQYTEASRYETINFDFNGWYNGPLEDLQTIIDLNSNEETAGDVLAGGSNANQIAVARILQTYFFHMITDRWGMAPYSAALQGRDNLQPAYDSQSAIYEGMITELKEAANQIEPGQTGVRGDILFEGDMEQWQRFANTLRMRIALRLSDVNESLASSEFQDAVNSGLIQENVMYPYLADANNENPWYERFRTRTDYAITEFMADEMKAIDDLRLTAYAEPAPAAANDEPGTQMEEVVGMPYGIAGAGDIENSEISFPGRAIGAGGPDVGIQDAPLPIITLAEVNFAKAEAVERGWITGSAADFYNQGIEESWKQWDVYNESDFADYIANSEVAYDPTQWDQKIGYQKWIALFPLGYEAWGEWRRLGYPELTPAPDALNETGEIPVRHGYPTTESELNRENYDAAVEAQGPDRLDTHLWWDVE